MGHDTVMVRIAENGRLSIPAKQRKLLGLEDGGLVVARVEGGELHLRPVRALLADLQEQVSQYLAGSGESVERFLADRPQEVSRYDDL